MTTLILMRQEEFEAFFEEAVRSYAADNVAAGRWLPDDALGLARVETERLLPQGLATPRNYLYDIQDEVLLQSVGFVWFAAMARGSTELAYVYQIQVKPEFRRKGHARVALLEVERIAATLGFTAIALHVFGFNTGAQALYNSLGYSVTNMNMQKLLPKNGA